MNMTSHSSNINSAKKVIIIGNGPSAIALSYILAGNWPYYDVNNPHPNEQLNYKLSHPPPGEAVSSSCLSSDGAGGRLCKLHSRPLSSAGAHYEDTSCDQYCTDDDAHEEEEEEEEDEEEYDEAEEIDDSENVEGKQKAVDNQLPSILKYDFAYLCSGVQGRSINPVSVLFDTLQFPNADFGMNHPSCLKWKYDETNCIDHLVIGQGPPGGSWNDMISCTETYSVSFSRWMQLPDLPISSTKYGIAASKGSLAADKLTSVEDERISLSNVAKYYKYYVATQKLSKYFVNNAIVTSVRFSDKHNLWYVTGWQRTCGPFNYWSHNVVLATGNNDLPNRLKVRGENYPFVLHSISEMDKLLNDAKNCNLHECVLIIGSGLSAADAIITCKQHNIPVKHVFRRHPDDPALIFNQLPENMYPEYHAVHEAMARSFHSSTHVTSSTLTPSSGSSTTSSSSSTGSAPSVSPTATYTPFPMHTVAEIRKNKEVVLTNLLKPDDCSTLPCRTTVKVSYVLALIGRRPELSFVKPKELRSQLPMFPGEAINPRSNPLRIHPYTHECISQKSLYAMGPLVGDNFVRFVQGAALAIARNIISTSTCDTQGDRQVTKPAQACTSSTASTLT